jgi:plasmid rolling circle replication initiator protein Rep
LKEKSALWIQIQKDRKSSDHFEKYRTLKKYMEHILFLLKKKF